MGASSGKTCLAVITVCVLAAAGTGCSFFGKESPKVPPPPGQLQDGTSVIGTWSMNVTDINTSGIPDYAITETFTFDGSGNAQVELRDQYAYGAICTGSGPYRIDTSGNVDIFIQAVSPPICGFPDQITFQNPTVTATSITYIEPRTGITRRVLADLEPQLGIVGLWVFGGQAGIDFIIFDQHGYFTEQTTIGGKPYLLQGFYVITHGELGLAYFTADASSIIGTTVFSSYVTNGQALLLELTTSQGTSQYTGTLL